MYNDEWRAFLRGRDGCEPTLSYLATSVIVDNIANEFVSDSLGAASEHRCCHPHGLTRPERVLGRRWPNAGCSLWASQGDDPLGTLPQTQLTSAFR
jgi:hypothetical protein